MSSTHNLLVELFVEELPPKALKKLGEAFGEGLLTGLRTEGLATEATTVNVFATPRRLAARLSAVLAEAPVQTVKHKLMPVAVGRDAAGLPTPALLKKLTALGLDASAAEQLTVAADGKAQALFFEQERPGARLAEGLQRALDAALAKLPIPKVMKYQLADGWTSVNFVRPAHGLVALHGADVIPVTTLGLVSGRQTRGHRFEAAVDPIVLQHADHYERQLAEQGAVVASFESRRGEIARQLQAAAGHLGLRVIDDEALLDEVTALVERSNVLSCQFEPEFLAVPQECLILTMKANQKYFPLLDAAGKLTHHFLVVSNISPEDASAVVGGNERVVRPRLADAKFFFDQDRKKTLASRVPSLDKVVYHGKLGSQGQRSARVKAIGHEIVKLLRMATVPYTVDAKDEFDVLDSKVQEAAFLAKADLLTDMVGEFPELQGVMGAYYARHEGLRDGVAIAIEDHYKPRFSGDALPRNHTGTVLALADKLETLVGLFGIGQLPTGDKDPFALRRHALGVIRILVEKNLPLGLSDLISAAGEGFRAWAEEAAIQAEGRPEGSFKEAAWKLDEPVREALSSFFFDRLSVLLRDQGFSFREVDAVLALRPPLLGDVPRRLEAVRAFSLLPEAAALAAANKRVSNILKKVEGQLPEAPDAALFIEAAERDLGLALAELRPAADRQFEAHDYAGSLRTLAALRAPVDAFFDGVMVNADDPALRRNRLALLNALHAAMNRVADLSRLAT